MKNRTKILFSAPVALILLMFFIVSAPAEVGAACPQGENQLEFLYANSGTDTNTAAHLVDSFPITENTFGVGDKITVHFSIDQGTGSYSGLSFRVNADSVATSFITAGSTNKYGTVTGGIAAATPTSTSWIFGTSLTPGAYELPISFGSSWTAGIHMPASSAHEMYWTWTAYKINGSGKCEAAAGSEGNPTSSASDTEAFMNIDAEQRTMVYVAILALALAAFNSAAFWAWRIVKGTKKEI